MPVKSYAKRIGSQIAVLQWVVVLVVGVIVVAIVLGLNLIPRLNDGQKVLNAAKPAFTAQRVAADRAGINIISHNVDMADPIVTPQGGGAAEVPALVAYIAKKEHISPAQALALAQKNFPHTTALLQAIPLSSVTAELPGLETFLEKALKVTPAQLTSALKTNFPALAQSIANLPAVTSGWESITGIGGLTRFDGTPVRSVPDLRTYFSADLIPVLEHQRTNFDSLDGTSSVSWIAPLLLIVGIVVILFAALMIVRNRNGVSRPEAVVSATVVPVVGVVVVALVLIISLIPRVSNGQKLLDALRPANAQQRVAGDRVGINMVSTIVDTENPIMTPAGGAAAEVPKLIAFVSQKTGLSQTAVVGALQKNFPHVAALLQAIPFSAVTAELPAVLKFLGPGVLPVIPRLAQTVQAAPLVTDGWNNVPGTAGATRFDGSPIKTVADVRTYFSSDVIPVLETQRTNYDNLVKTSKIDFLGPLVLIIGIIVILYGLLMVLLAWRTEPEPEASMPKVAMAASSSV
jgi:uncharacterized membrane protein